MLRKSMRDADVAAGRSRRRSRPGRTSCAAAAALTAAALAAAAVAASARETAWGEWGCGRWNAFEVDHDHDGAAGAEAAAADRASRGKGAFDESTGSDNRNWPPDPLVDFRHLRLDLDLVDLDGERFEGLATYRLAPIGVPVRSLALDCAGLDVRWVRWGKGSPRAGTDIEHYRDGSRLQMRFDEALPPGDSEIEIRYCGERPTSGLIFTPSLPGEPSGEGERWPPGGAPEVHSQGQAESNHHWFPCHDFPNVRLPVDLVITAPKGLAVSGNGMLVERGDAPPGGVTGAASREEPLERWHWRQEKPIVPYLVAIVAGRFARVPLQGGERGLPMHVWVPPEREADVERTFGNTGAMVDLFERVFGQPYPWARYDQIVVRNFGAGGMENVSATTLHPGSLFDEIAGEEEDLDGLIAHELCHQWTGDLLTCRSWAHIWLNEGWATYGSALWFEARDGEEGYFDSMYGSSRVAERDTADGALPMVSPIYRNPGETFRRPANPYSKGSSILHMLRERLGDEIFFEGVRRYMAAHAGGLVETDDFRRALEAASGLSLEWFFDQWCMRPGCPRLKAEVDYDAESRTLRVRVEQTQKIDERTPAFRLDLPIHVETAGGARTIPWEIRERTAERTIELDGPPTLVAIDPRLAALKTIEVDMSTELLAACARRGPTQAARRAAIDALAQRNEPASVEVLARIASSDEVARSSRRSAIEALAGFGTPEALAALRDVFDAGVADPRVRVALVEALRKLPKDDAAERLERIALHDRSYQCRAAAARGLGAIGAADRAEVLLALAAVPSHQERIRVSAIEALAELGHVGGIEPALALARRGNFDRARPSAIEALGRLAAKASAEERERVIAELVALLDDPERRSRDAAGEALAALGAREATERIQAIASSDRDPSRRERADRWLRRIRGGRPSDAESVRTP